MRLKKIHLVLLPVFGGILFSLGWPLKGIPLFLFFAFLPFLYVEDYLHKHKADFSKFSIFLYAYPGFFVWNLLINYWICNATFPGGIAAILLNSFFMTVPFSVYHISKRILYTQGKGHFLLIFYWLAFEYFHLDWFISFPWLNLGNGFANWHTWIQWYEYTGTMGGSLWILLLNILIYQLLIRFKAPPQKKIYLQSVLILGIFLLPVLFSLSIYRNYKEQTDPVNILVVQPNLDPYSEQYGLHPTVVMNRMLKLAETKTDTAVDFIVFPESANQQNIFEENINKYSTIARLRNYLKDYPGTKIITGASTFKVVYGKDTLSNAARKFQQSKGYYYAFNTAIYIDTSQKYQLYHKSRLTAGVEKMPSLRWLKSLEKFAIDLGGTIGTLATDEKRKNFISPDSLHFATVICYESIYGEFVSRFVKKGAQFIFIITNDGWWGNTGGHRQHFIYAKLRAIETRRAIARSANTGISAFINQRGDVGQQTPYWVPAAIRANINRNQELSFYVKNGDYIARIASLISALFILISISMALRTRL